MNRHLPTLSVLHYVYGIFTCVTGLAMLMIVLLGGFLSSDFIAEQSNDPAAGVVGTVFQVLGWVAFALIEAWGVLIILSGRWIDQRRNRMGTLIVAALCCLSIPFGLALGIFTFVTLLNQDVEREYNGTKPAIA